MALERGILRLYLVTDRLLCAEMGLTETVTRAVQGGVTCVQLRDKLADTRERVDLTRALKAALHGSGVPVIVNDDVEAAYLADADGVHVGQGDATAKVARARLGPGKIVGLSCETATHVEAVEPRVVDYLGIGTVFATPTKDDHTPPIGIEGLARLCALSPLPCVAIGGLKPAHNSAALTAGADGLAVVSAICGQPDPTRAARAFFQNEEQ